MWLSPIRSSDVFPVAIQPGAFAPRSPKTDVVCGSVAGDNSRSAPNSEVRRWQEGTAYRENLAEPPSVILPKQSAS